MQQTVRELSLIALEPGARLKAGNEGVRIPHSTFHRQLLVHQDQVLPRVNPDGPSPGLPASTSSPFSVFMCRWGGAFPGSLGVHFLPIPKPCEGSIQRDSITEMRVSAKEPAIC